ncbi:MAG: o-succinylbenzoate synthase [Spirulinaceae cyanobacterium]
MYKLTFTPYQRRFNQPLKTSHGVWEIREGIIICLTDGDGNKGWGEIAPLPWFGSETLAAAEAFCRELSSQITKTAILAIPNQLPACQFAFESALEELETSPHQLELKKSLNYSYLLPAGEDALTSLKLYSRSRELTFKWKIGLAPVPQELTIFEQLIKNLPSAAKLRLDANGGLNLKQAQEWLKAADSTSGIVEYIEQPLAPSQFMAMLVLSEQYATPLALDESVATLKQLEDCYRQGWRSIFVIKAAIAGSPQRLRQFCQQHQIDAVFSSVLATKVARKAALRLATELSSPHRAVGFGVDRWFMEND